jgi:hypothetical protein
VAQGVGPEFKFQYYKKKKKKAREKLSWTCSKLKLLVLQQIP